MTSYDSITIPYLFITLVGMPAMGVRSYFRLKSGKPLAPKNRRYATMIAMQGWLLGYTILVARQNRIELLGRAPALWVWCAAAVYLTLIAVRLERAWKKLNPERKQRARILLPENFGQLGYWVPISLFAGLSEECSFRGMAHIGLRDISESATLSLVICVLAFAVAHMMQGWRGVLGTAVIALLMHALVFLTQGLYLAIAIHAAYDLIIGTIAIRQFRREETTLAAESQPISSG